MRVYINPLESMLNKYGEVRFILSSMYYDMTGIATRHRNIYLDTATFMSVSMTADRSNWWVSGFFLRSRGFSEFCES